MKYVSGSDLRKMRLTAGFTTQQMAEFAQVKARKTYENWEKNKGQPDVNQYLSMAAACGYELPCLIESYCERADKVVPGSDSKLCG